MDLSFPSFDRADELVAWPGDLAALMVGVAARQGASRTAIVQALLPAGIAPHPGEASFNAAVAALLVALAERPDVADADVNGPFTAAGQAIFNACCQNDRHAFKPGTGAPIEDL